MILSIIFLICAAICNAIMDTLQFHYYVSIFNGLNAKFWDPEKSWNNSYVIPYSKYKVDSWHIFKSLMIIFLALHSYFIIDNYHFSLGYFIIDLGAYLIAYGVIWNCTFNLFYNKILKR